MADQKFKREKIFLSGYEMWLDRRYGAALLIFDKEDSKHGICVDAMGTYPHLYISALDLTKEEKKELADYLNQ